MQVGSGSFFHFDFQDPDPAKDWPDPQPFYVTVRYQEAKYRVGTFWPNLPLGPEDLLKQ